MAGHHKNSRRGDSGRDQAESQKSVDKAAGRKSEAKVNDDDDWGFEPRKGGMAVEAKMGMCIVVILISAFGFLVYRKFDAKQRALLQANLNAAEVSLPGSTAVLDDGPFAEFQPNATATNNGVTENVKPDLTALVAQPSFESSFALQDPGLAETNGVDPSADFETTTDQSFANLSEPAAEPAFDGEMLVASNEPATGPVGTMTSPQEQMATFDEPTSEPTDTDSPFAKFDSFEAAPTEAAVAASGEAAEEPAFEEFSGFGAETATTEEGRSDVADTADEPVATPAFDSFPSGFDVEEPAVAEAPADSPAEQTFPDFDLAETAKPEEQQPEDSGWASTPPTTTQPSPFDNFDGGSPVETNVAESTPAPQFNPFDEPATQTPAATPEIQPGFDTFAQDDSPFAEPIETVESAPAANADVFNRPSIAEPKLKPLDDTSVATFERSRPQVDPSIVMESSARSEINVRAPMAGSLETDPLPLPEESQTFPGGFPSNDKNAQFVSRSEIQTDPSLLVPDEPAHPAGVDPQLSASFDQTPVPENQPFPGEPAPLKMPTYDAEIPRSTAPTIQQPQSNIRQVSATRQPDGVYTVKEDDTYWTISKHAYGTARFFSSLALYNSNRIKDPRRLRQGMKVVIPDPEVLIERYPELLKDYIPKQTKPAGYFLRSDGSPAYRIGARETLSEISQKHLGRASRWVQIYRMNQHVLKNPNRLKPGIEIDLPDDATNVRMVP